MTIEKNLKKLKRMKSFPKRIEANFLKQSPKESKFQTNMKRIRNKFEANLKHNRSIFANTKARKFITAVNLGQFKTTELTIALLKTIYNICLLCIEKI